MTAPARRVDSSGSAASRSARLRESIGGADAPAVLARRVLGGAGLATLCAMALAAPAHGQQSGSPAPKPAPAQDAAQAAAAAALQQVQALSAQVEALTRQVQSLSTTTTQLQSELAAARAAAPAAEADDYYIPRLAGSFQDSGLTPSLGNVYTKPYLTNLGKRTYLGGYFDLQAINPAGSDKKKNFEPDRFVPFIYSDVSDRVKFASEIEIEDGHETELEFAQIDYLMTKAANFRAGIQLLPLGKFNEVHDSPIQELTDRPLVDTFVIPTTLRDAGVGLYGDLSDQVSYAATITNGFRGLDAAGNNVITPEDGLAEARPHEFEIGTPFENQNDKLAYTQRVAWKPELGMEFGASALFDTYDEKGDNSLDIYALDATLDGKAVGFLPDQLELIGEAAWAAIERDDFAKASGVAGDMNGWYAQANWHCDPAWLEAWKQNGTVEKDAHFTLVARYDDVMLDTYDRRRTTFGINFRPNAHDTVFKLDYQFNDDSGSLAGSNNDDALLFSVATYF